MTSLTDQNHSKTQAKTAQIIFVDDDETDLLILRRILRPVSGEWDMTFVSSGQDALKAMEQSRFAMIVSDMQMPGMDGVELLERVKQRYPDMVRIILSSVAEEETKLRAVQAAHIWMAKPCDVEFLKNIVERTGAWAAFLHDAPLNRLIGQMQSLPSLPHLYLQLGKELRSPDTSFRRVAQIMARDIGMTAKILQLVNSAFFGPYNNVSSLEQAAIVLGLSTIRALVLSVGVFSQFDIGKQKGFSAEALMNHSLAAGALTQTIAKTETRNRSFLDEAFMAGMLHDTGKLVLAHNMPGEYDRALTLAHEQSLPHWRAEQEVFGASHAYVSAYLLALWGMADAIVEASAYHHNPSDCKNKQFSALTAVHVANVLEHGEQNNSEALKTQDVDHEYLVALNMDNRLAKWTEACHPLTLRPVAC